MKILKRLTNRLFFLCIGLGILSFSVSAQTPIPDYPDSLFSTYYHQKATQYKRLPKEKGQTVFLGNSITDGGSWSELFQDANIVNRGISGDVTKGVLNRLENVVQGKPEKVFLLIGTNDLAHGAEKDSVIRRTRQIVSLIHEHSPGTKIFVQSIFPVNGKPGKFPGHAKNGAAIKAINKALKQKAGEDNYTYIDVYGALKNQDDKMDLAYSNDGLHLLGKGYMIWKHLIYPYVYDLQEKPALIPKPQSLTWNENQQFPLYKEPAIVSKEDSLEAEAETLQRALKKKGVHSKINDGPSRDKSPSIILKIDTIDVPRYKKEGYTLNVGEQTITITGNTTHGVFNGIQTLRQLIRDGVFVDGVQIKDWPAFSWRGYMIDVGRNYQSISQIKEQIDEMAHYKLNIFHFHLTEDVAWRLQIKQYPELTKGKTMTRDAGQYYTIDQMHDLIHYAENRHITLVPEIDMPGHSEAFKKATDVDMQSEKGLDIVKNIVTEVDSTYNVPYLHIGADEVEFTNEDFIPEVTQLAHNQGKTTIGWAPGGNYDDKTIRQLWKSEGPQDTIEQNENSRYIDSRALYINHMDPLSGVVSIFNHKIDDVEHGNQNRLGGEIALWNDDRAKDQESILNMNFAYPALLAFGERAWRGGGHDRLTADMGPHTSSRYKAFTDFENRLLDHKIQFFQDKPFPYVAQSDIQWKLFGPYDNGGELTKSFWPEESEAARLTNAKDSLHVNGGTIWLRHFFTPAVEGALDDPEENSTWYAFRRIYSPADTTGKFWISFYNPSRSYAIATPEDGQWDKRESQLWINDEKIDPPKWTYPGRDNETWEDPLVDESYEARPPTEVQLHKGWNTILVKAPAGSFEGKSWQHPVKWMFTVVQVQ